MAFRSSSFSISRPRFSSKKIKTLRVFEDKLLTIPPNPEFIRLYADRVKLKNV